MIVGCISSKPVVEIAVVLKLRPPYYCFALLVAVVLFFLDLFALTEKIRQECTMAPRLTCWGHTGFCRFAERRWAGSDYVQYVRRTTSTSTSWTSPSARETSPSAGGNALEAHVRRS